MNRNLTLIFLIQCKYYKKKKKKKKIIISNIFFVLSFWPDIFIAYTAFYQISTFLCHFSPRDLPNFTGSTIIFFIATLIIRWFCQIVALPRWTWLLFFLTYFLIDNRTWWYFLSYFSPLNVLTLFCGIKFMSVLFIETFALSWISDLGSFLKVPLKFNG